jgi:hypothetical protein
MEIASYACFALGATLLALGVASLVVQVWDRLRTGLKVGSFTGRFARLR